MTLRVRLFAILRERAGRDAVEIELPEGATVAEALGQLAMLPGLSETLAELPVIMAVNREYAGLQRRLRAEDELALIPPISGGAEVHARVHAERLSADALSRVVADPGAGAILTFQGVTREIERIDYEAYREMAEERIAAILTGCVERHGLLGAAAEHRVGGVPLGEAAVVVAVAAAHREEAFAGGREAIDRIKAEVPIWKREVLAAGARWVEGARPLRDRGSAGTSRLSHLDPEGRARMVDVGAKQLSERGARARARVRMSPGTARAVEAGDGPKGEVLGVARLAGVQAAKQTGTLIPLAHPLQLTFVDVEGDVDVEAGIVELVAEARTVGRTGVEMEAMTACAVAALTVYDMVKGIERGVRIGEVVLLEKTGGRSDWHRDANGRG